MSHRNFPLLFFISLLLLAGLACSQMSLMGGTEPLSGQAYWTNATGTPLPTQTVFLGMTTPVYPPTPVPAVITEPPLYATTDPIWMTVTATSNPPWEPPTFTPIGFVATDYWVTSTPEWITTTPVWITETPVPPWTTTPELPMIGFTTPVPADTPYYRVGTFYLNQDVYVDGPQGLVFRLTAQETFPSSHHPERESYLLLHLTVKNHAGRETAVSIPDLFFIREVHTSAGLLRGMWLPKDEPLLELGYPSYETQLLDEAGTPLTLTDGQERQYTLGFILPTGTVSEVGMVTDLSRPVNGGVPIWFYLQEDPLSPFAEPCSPQFGGYIPGCQPLPPTPILFDENGTYGGNPPGAGTPNPYVTPGTDTGVWPTNGVLLRGYGCDDFYTGIDGAGFGCPAEQPWFHNGVDIANVSGNPIYSPIDGEVVFASFNPAAPDCSFMAGSQPPHQGLGNYQRITDGLTQHYLAHLSGFLLTSGGVVTGQMVSMMGSTGCSVASHLHWMVYENGNLIDPAAWAGP